ncbi:MAG: cytidylate kinase-like family protein [Firmicutes bacterium]|nr:cytidylate kinase-like family protein [Bacillota bacterium]
MGNKIITVSRQFGSGGRTIGRMVAEKLGIPCYDQELIEKIAKESGLAEEYVEERGEHMPSSSWIANALAVRSVSGMINEDQLWSSQCKVIFDIADQGPCVIIGRCADHILKGKHDLITVFIHAPMEKRAERIINVYGEKNVSIEKRINDKDKRRKAYYQLYTDSEWGAATNYDITLNSASIGFEKCVDIIADLYNNKKTTE